jgi:ribonuclease HI
MGKTKWILPSITTNKPLPTALLIATDGSSNGKGAIFTYDQTEKTEEYHIFKDLKGSAQLIELQIIHKALDMFHDVPFNLLTDSQYCAQSLLHLEDCFIKHMSQVPVVHLLLSIQTKLRCHSHPIFIGHIQAHSNFPGPLSRFNGSADALT